MILKQLVTFGLSYLKYPAEHIYQGSYGHIDHYITASYDTAHYDKEIILNRDDLTLTRDNTVKIHELIANTEPQEE